jgi:cyanide dihydratase
MRTYPTLRAAAVQASSVYLDMNASVKKACRLIEEAAKNGAQLVAFPESFLPGYPYWCFMDDPVSMMAFTQSIFASALYCPGTELSVISQCAKDNNIFVCITATERESSTVYDTQFLIDNHGNLLGKHRKIKPMGSERMIWGQGDGSTMRVQETPLGRIGSLFSCEHMNPMNSMVQCSQMEEIHIASYPALPSDPSDYMSFDVNYALLNYYAVSDCCYVIMSTQVMDQATKDLLTKPSEGLLHNEHPEYERFFGYGEGGLGGGHACILNPDGEIISDVLAEDEEGLVYADLDLKMIGIANFFGDTTGHYCNPAVHLEVDVTPRKVVRFSGEPVDNSLSYESMQQF